VRLNLEIVYACDAEGDNSSDDIGRLMGACRTSGVVKSQTLLAGHQSWILGARTRDVGLQKALRSEATILRPTGKYSGLRKRLLML
jgi:hypothetical protein